VVFLYVHALHPFNRALQRHFADAHGSRVQFAAVDFRELLMSGSPAIAALHAGLSDCGGPSKYGVLPGYWLFHKGHVLAWDAGLPSTADAKGIAQKSVLGAIWWAFTRNIAYIGQAVHVAAEEAAAQRMATQFRDVMTSDRKGESKAPPPRPANPLNELAWAYKTLGLLPSASDQEVNDAWRKLRAHYHPDRAAHDPAEFERRSRISVELNAAREIILKHRARQSKPAA
jgi:hypothetical protein